MLLNSCVELINSCITMLISNEILIRKTSYGNQSEVSTYLGTFFLLPVVCGNIYLHSSMGS